MGDKAYLSEDILGWLWTKSIKAVIPVKKQWDPATKRGFYEPALQLVEWFDKNQPGFHEIYRLRPKIEAFFSAMKRVTSIFCWPRGRKRCGRTNSDEPCTAWINETLCKLIYMNLRTTVRYQELTGYVIDYGVAARCFPAFEEELLPAA